MKPVVITTCTVLVMAVIMLMIIPQAYSIEILYPSIDYKHAKIPNYCIVRPSDSQLNEDQRDWMVQKGQDAVAEWKSTLKEKMTHYYKWGLSSQPISDASSTFLKCDWTISFQPEISSLFTFGVVLGYADITNQEIVIRYMKIDPDEFHDILLHEIGHSLGLGHYTTEDYQIMSKWLSSESPPSIMIPNIHSNPGLTYITDVDIDKLKSIYGTGGFIREFEKENESAQLQFTAINALDSLSVSPETIIVKKYQTNMITISGQLKKEFVLSGVPLHLVTIKPDLSTTVSKIYTTSSGKFQIPLLFDEQSPKGEYSIELVYRDRTINNQPVKYWLEDEFSSKPVQNIETESKTIPLWVKNNAKWWSEGLVDDKSFVSGIQYLVEQKIIVVPNLSAKSSITSNEIPSWIKNNAGWWANGDISEDEFLKGLEFLVKQGIIRV